jgi:MraZ protein
VVSIGVSSRIEIWSKEKWEEYNDLNLDFDEIAEQMSDLGI